MTNKTGKEFDQRLRAALNRSLPPTPRPERARYSRTLGASHPMLGFKVALAAACAVALTIGVSAITGSADPAVWTQRAVTTVQSVTQHSEPSPTSETEHPPQGAQTKPTTQPTAAKTSNPSRESPDPSEDSHRGSGSQEASGSRTHPPDEWPSGRPGGASPGTPGRDN
jgi:hypothetical protein